MKLSRHLIYIPGLEVLLHQVGALLPFLVSLIRQICAIFQCPYDYFALLITFNIGAFERWIPNPRFGVLLSNDETSQESEAKHSDLHICSEGSARNFLNLIPSMGA